MTIHGKMFTVAAFNNECLWLLLKHLLLDEEPRKPRSFLLECFTIYDIFKEEILNKYKIYFHTLGCNCGF